MKNMLLVDDHDMFRESLSLALGQRLKGVDIRHVATGREAIEAFDSSDGFDLVLLDLYLGDMTGKAVFTQLREKRQEQVIAMLSGSTQVSDLRWAMENGANGFIPKSFRIDILAAILELLQVNGRYFPDLRAMDRGALPRCDRQSLEIGRAHV